MKQHIAGATLGAAVALGGQSFLGSPDTPPYEAVEASLRADEGFRAHPYRDTRGVLTVGYGTNLDVGITRDEAAYLLRSRLERNGRELAKLWGPFKLMRPEVRGALVEMSYQLGPAGVLEFKRMLAALAARDYEAAAQEALASRWAQETPRRAARVAQAFRGQ